MAAVHPWRYEWAVNVRKFFVAVLAGGSICLGAAAGYGAQETGLSPQARAAGDAYLRALGEAGAAYARKDFAQALSKLDLADDIQPGVEDTFNMRGAIYADEHDFDKAEKAFAMAMNASPRDFWPQYNLAQLQLSQGKYAVAADAFRKLLVYAGHEELVEFKVVYSELLTGNADAAQPVLDAMKFPSDTPAYYFAHAAWGFAHKDEKEGNSWVHGGLKVFGPGRCAPFYDALAAVKWVAPRDPKDGSIPEPADLLGAPDSQ